MRVLHTESMGVSGGQTRRVVDELKILKERGHQGYLVCCSDTWLEKFAKDNGIEVLNAPLLNPLDIFSAAKIAWYIKKYNIDIVHSHDSKDGYPALYASKLTGTKYIRARHNDLTKKPGIIYKFSDAIITTGTKIAEELVREGVDRDKIVSIPSYPDEKIFIPDKDLRESLRESYGVSDKVVIATLSGLNDRKRPHLILEALAILKEKYPDFLYIVAGPEGKDRYMDEFFALVDKLKLREYVKFVGFVSPKKFLNMVDIYICGSRKEGIPQAMMQAMMMGCAVVSVEVGSIRDLNVRNNLLIVEENSDKDTFEILLEILLSDRKHMRELGRLNRELALKQFNRTVMGDMLIETYERVLER